MYLPPLFREDRLGVMHDLIVAHPFGLLVSAGAGGLTANAVPFVLDAQVGEKGRLRAHVARANPHWREFAGEGCDCLVVFQGPQAYVTPSWYASKREHGKVVPTWNYVMVQVRGRGVAHEDAAWLRPQIEVLTESHEGNRAAPWSVTDAPEDFVAQQTRAIVGLEIAIASIAGKWKVSQNRPEADRRGVHAGLTAEGDHESALMAQLVGACLPSAAADGDKG